jgi:putative membrane protein
MYAPDTLVAYLLGLSLEKDMKNISISSLGLLFLLAGCHGGASDSVKKARDSNAARIDSQAAMGRLSDTAKFSRSDADFLVDASSRAMKEMELGQVAQTHSSSQRVKSFGAMMVKSQGEGIEEIKKLAVRKHVTLPDSVSLRQEKEINKLKKKEGGDFDKAYIKMTVNDHKADIKEFEKQASDGSDTITKVFASFRLQMLRRGLDSANSLMTMLPAHYP